VTRYKVSGVDVVMGEEGKAKGKKQRNAENGKEAAASTIARREEKKRGRNSWEPQLEGHRPRRIGRGQVSPVVQLSRRPVDQAE